MRATAPALKAVDVWDVLRSAISTRGSPGPLLNPLNFNDEFNYGVLDAEVWTETLDGAGTGAFAKVADYPTLWRLTTGNVIDNDASIHGSGVAKNYHFTPNEDGYTTVTFEAHIRLSSIADVSCFIGLCWSAVASYAEPALDAAHFLMDPAVTNTFRARSYNAAEQESDSLVALDTAWHKLRLAWTATSVLFYLDDVLVATHSTQVPDTPMAMSLCIRTEAAAQKSLEIDKVSVVMG